MVISMKFSINRKHFTKICQLKIFLYKDFIRLQKTYRKMLRFSYPPRPKFFEEEIFIANFALSRTLFSIFRVERLDFFIMVVFTIT